MKVVFPVIPVSKPRMTQSDKWKKRKCTTAYWGYKDKLNDHARKHDFVMPESDYHLIFVIPMPKNWSKKKKLECDGTKHQQKPDKDNLEKGFLDALCKEDSHIWDGRVTKIWGSEGRIIIKDI